MQDQRLKKEAYLKKFPEEYLWQYLWQAALFKHRRMPPVSFSAIKQSNTQIAPADTQSTRDRPEEDKHKHRFCHAIDDIAADHFQWSTVARILWIPRGHMVRYFRLQYVGTVNLMPADLRIR